MYSEDLLSHSHLSLDSPPALQFDYNCLKYLKVTEDIWWGI